MIGWAVAFLLIALLGALFGFTGLGGAAVGAARLIFFVFIALFAIALILRALRRGPPV